MTISRTSRRVRGTQILLGVAMVLALVVVRGTHAGNEPIHMTTDWSHRHVIFSAPHNLGQHVQFLSNPRYVQQLVRRNAGKSGIGDPDAWRWHRAPESPDLLNGDWSMDMGPGATVGAGNYPAKFSFDINSAKCASDPNPDFVVYNTSLAGSATSADAHQTVTFGTSGSGNAPAGTVIIKNGAITLTLTASTTLNTGLDFLVHADNGNGNRTTNATDLAAAINRVGNGSSVGVSATSAAGVVTITATTAGSAGNAITLTGTINGSRGVAFGGATFTGGLSPQASIIAFDNLYTGCGAPTPSTYWAYNTGGTVVTSPVLSGDGKQIAFVQNVGTTASLVLLKWAASGSETYNSPATLTTQASPAAYTTCTAPCMYTMAFTGTGTITDTKSSPFYDYTNDVMWVGDNGDHLQKFTGVFNGSPLHVTTGGFPATLTAGSVAGSPVFDETSGKVYIADGTPAGMGAGQIYSVNATTGAVVESLAQLSRGVGFADGVMLDPINETMYLFTADNTGVTCPGTNNAVITMGANFAAGAAATNITPIATGNTCSATLSIYDGTFDNAYYSGGAGHLYVCGNVGGAPTLFQVAASATGVLSTVNTGPALAATGNTCGPVTEVYNPNATGGAKDWIFASVENGGVTGGVINCPAASGCIMSFDVTSGAAITTATPTVGHVSVAGGASGVVVDNTVATGTLAGASQIYFTPLADQACTTSGGTGGCAIQASQSAIQ